MKNDLLHLHRGIVPKEGKPMEEWPYVYGAFVPAVITLSTRAGSYRNNKPHIISNIGVVSAVVPEMVDRFTGGFDMFGNPIFTNDDVIIRANSKSEILGASNGRWKTKAIFDTLDLSFKFVTVSNGTHIEWHINDTDFNGKKYTFEVIRPDPKAKELFS